MAPMPGDRRRFDPVDEEEAAWCHMERSVNATLPLLMKFGHEFDYGSPTELELEHVAVFGELVQRPAPSQPWHGGRVVVLARNDPLRAGLRCRRPAQWKSVPEYDEELYEDEGVMWTDGLEPVIFCDECAPEDGDFIPLPNSPREGVNRYDNVHSWRAWPLPDDDGW